MKREYVKYFEESHSNLIFLILYFSNKIYQLDNTITMNVCTGPFFFLLTLWLVIQSPGNASSQPYKEQKCVKMTKITKDLCQSMPYQSAVIPNIRMGTNTIDGAVREMEVFSPLIKVGCSDSMGFYVCGMYLPKCNSDHPSPIYPCREVCEDARKGCEPLMKRFGFRWPENLACDLLPSTLDRNTTCTSPP